MWIQEKPLSTDLGGPPTTQAALSWAALSRAALSRLLEWELSQWTPTCTALAGTRHASSPSRALPAVNT